MKKLYEKYKKLNIDHAAIGLEMSSEESTYFCTPKGAKIIGWAGVDGIHFCFVRGLGETVFAVNPMSAYNDDYVNPVANSFEDFMRLIVTCGSANPVEQIVWMSKQRFEEHLRTEKSVQTKEQEKVLEQLKTAFELTAMEKPYEYVKNIQKDFDDSKIKYSDEYYDIKGIEKP